MKHQEPKGSMASHTAQFPCTLRDLVGDAPFFHVYTEYRGLRYYVASEAAYRNAMHRTEEYRIAYPRAMTYLRDRADSTQIDGTWQELRAVYHQSQRNTLVSYFRLTASHGWGVVYYGQIEWCSYSYWQCPDLSW